MLSFMIRLSTFEIPVVEAHITSNVLTVQFRGTARIVTMEELQIQHRPVGVCGRLIEANYIMILHPNL